MPSDVNEARDGEARWRRILGRRPIAAAAVAALVLLVGGAGFALVGGDGSDGGDGGGSGSGEGELTPEEAGLAFARCMRDQGIDEFPDPVVEDDGTVMFEGLADLGVPSEQMQAAQEACGPLLDEGSPAGPAGTGERQEVRPAAAGWEEIVPGGDCQCADGSEYSFFARAASPDKVVLLLDGGGVCWSAETCAPDGGNQYQTTVDGPNGEGVFDFADERNPFADYSSVFVPYCTGDLFLGDATAEYTPDLTIRHKGYVDGTAALDYLATTFPDASDVVVIGASAGSVSAPLYGGMVADRLPGAEVTVFADSSGAFPDVPKLDDVFTGGGWGASDVLPGWSEGDEGWSAPGLVVQSGRHDPDVVFARYDHAYDENQRLHLTLAGVEVDDLLALVDANEAQIEDAGVDLLSYVAPGDDHVVFDNASFYDQVVDGRALADWVGKVVARAPVDDVHCTGCTTG